MLTFSSNFWKSCTSCLIFRRQERKVGQNIFDNLASLLFFPRPPLCHFIPLPPRLSSFFSSFSSSSSSSSVVSASRSLLLGHAPLPATKKHNNAELNWPVFFCPQLKLNPKSTQTNLGELVADLETVFTFLLAWWKCPLFGEYITPKFPGQHW